MYYNKETFVCRFLFNGVIHKMRCWMEFECPITGLCEGIRDVRVTHFLSIKFPPTICYRSYYVHIPLFTRWTVDSRFDKLHRGVGLQELGRKVLPK